MKSRKAITILALLVVILLMAMGYSAFSTQLNVNGTAEIIGEWNIMITDIKIENVSSGCDAGTPEFTNTTATFYAKLKKPGDIITYVITIQNAGTIDAVLDDVVFFTDSKDSSPAILYETSRLKDSLAVGEKTALTLTVKYDENATKIPDVTTQKLTGIIQYSQS